VAWKFEGLGAENRVRLCRCIEIRVRREFPNPRCGEGCDYSVNCEARRHYTGFRSAVVSRADREGRFINLAVV
jgi:hypothetical protein